MTITLKIVLTMTRYLSGVDDMADLKIEREKNFEGVKNDVRFRVRNKTSVGVIDSIFHSKEAVLHKVELDLMTIAYRGPESAGYIEIHVEGSKKIMPKCDKCGDNRAVIDQVENLWCFNCQHIVKENLNG